MNPEFSNAGLTRRAVLKQAAAAGCLAVAPRHIAGAESKAPAWHDEIVAYLETLARPDGGYAWGDQPASHLSPTFAAIACYQALGRPIPRPETCAQYVRTHHPTEWKKLEQEHREFDFQQIQSLLWLGESASPFIERVQGWTVPVPYLAQYERHKSPVFRFQLAAITCRKLLGLPLEPVAQEYTAYLTSRRRANGSFNNTPADAGGDGNVLNTWWGLESLAIVSSLDPLREPTIAWLQACQAPQGGFRWQPTPTHGVEPDVAYTWAALRSLALLGGKPTDTAAAIRSLFALRNPDGGFGDRPGWASNAVATRYALESLAILGALQQAPAETVRPARPKPPLPEGLQVYSMQIESHGTGSPAEAVDLARALRIDLWGAKNAKPAWLEAVQGLADRDKVPVRFFTANEEYGTWIDLPGFGTYSHMSDIVAPAGASIGAPQTGDEAATWSEFRSRRIEPLVAGQGRLVWQFGENEELVRTLLDDSLERGGNGLGYAAISTFHFGNPDFTNSEPFLKRYRGHLPFVALQDAHGPEPWWFSDMTTGFRTLFLATEPTWEGWLTALRNDWVAAVRRDAVTSDTLRMHAGSDEVAQLMMARQDRWRWWDNPAIARPLVSLVVLKAGDQFESGVPDQGVAIRVRCAWTNTNQGVPKAPLAELKSLIVDGRSVEAESLAPAGRRGAQPSDRAHLYRLPEIAAGDHTVSATVTVLADRREVTRELRFTI